MRTLKILGLSLVTLTTVATATAPAFARPHRHQVCHVERHHGHPVRVCHWVR